MNEYEQLQRVEAKAKEQMLKAFELGKNLRTEEFNERNKWHKRIAWGLYKSFRKTYPWMPFNPQWRISIFNKMTTKEAQEIAEK